MYQGSIWEMENIPRLLELKSRNYTKSRKPWPEYDHRPQHPFFTALPELKIHLNFKYVTFELSATCTIVENLADPPTFVASYHQTEAGDTSRHRPSVEYTSTNRKLAIKTFRAGSL